MDQDILTRAELEAHDPEGGRGGRWLCPFPACSGHTDKRRHRNLDVEPEGQKSGVFFCHRCGAKGQLKDYWKDFVPESSKAKAQRVRLRRDAEEARKLEEIGARFRGQGKPLSVAALLALGVSGQASVMSTMVDNPPVTEPAQNGSSRTVHPELKETLYRAGSLQGLDTEQAHAFLSSRGFLGFLGVLTRARVRFALDFGRRVATQEKGAYQGAPAVVFPISDDAGQLVAFQGRKVAPKEGETKVLSFGPKSAGLFWAPGALEAWQEGSPIALTEAPLDALTLALCEVPAVAICGSSAPPAFLTRGAFGRRYWLAFDADDAGDKAAETLGASLKRAGGLVERLRPEGAKDWNEILQQGGEAWTRTAQSLRALIAREDEASKATGEPSAEAPQEHDPMHRALPHGCSEKTQGKLRENSGDLPLPSAEQWRAWFASDRSSPSPGLPEGMTREQAGLPVQQVATLSPGALEHIETENAPRALRHIETENAPQLAEVGSEPLQWRGIAAAVYSPEVQLPLAVAWQALHGGHMEAWAWGEVPDVRAWLLNTAEHLEGLRSRIATPEDPEGALWTGTLEGGLIARDLIAFARWYAGA